MSLDSTLRTVNTDMYRIDIGGNLRELLFEPAEVQKS